jgi:hypothetical protein
VAVATPSLKRRQQVLKPRGSLEIDVTLEPLLFCKQGQHRRDRYGKGPSVRPGSQTGARAQDGSPGNLRDPIHVHATNEPDKRDHRLNKDPGPNGASIRSGASQGEHELWRDRVGPGNESNK